MTQPISTNKASFSRIKFLSLGIKATAFLSAFLGVYLCTFSEKNSFMGGIHAFMFFTIQSNVMIAILSLIGFIQQIRKEKTTLLWQVIFLVGTVSITLTGFVFCFVLAPTFGKNAFNLQNTLTHVVVPVLSILDFLLSGKEWEIKPGKKAIYVIIPPLMYVIYAAIGYVCNWNFMKGKNYPYFFLNWGSEAGAFGFCEGLPFMGVFWWILVLSIFLILVAQLYLWILTVIRKKNNR